jgi:hypothetical protein
MDAMPSDNSAAWTERECDVAISLPPETATGARQACRAESYIRVRRYFCQSWNCVAGDVIKAKYLLPLAPHCRHLRAATILRAMPKKGLTGKAKSRSEWQ